MPHEEYSLFESVIHITEERDKRSLEKSLINTLVDFINFESIILFRVPLDKDSNYLEVAKFIPETATPDRLKLIPTEFGDQRAQKDNSISICLEKGEIISDKQDTKQRMLFPIIVNNVVSGFLDIDGLHSTAYTERLIRGFIRIYSNFQAIINDNEHDTLTGLLNRKTFDSQLSELLSTASKGCKDIESSVKNRRNLKSDTRHWLGMLDIDHFKRINDDFGHTYGDEVLLLFADLMRKSFRSGDLLFRYGGEEFIVVLTPTVDVDAFIIFDRFRQKLESFDFPQVGRVTVSVGMVKIGTQDFPTTILENADKALYYSKEHGRNRVCNYEKLIEKGHLKEKNIKNDVELF